ncbi:hypothetical protein C8R44DRAFT_56607 [Mycena epipterygia]|nr:hypothetical protein C8R44DRAFT_56607 [Mycena epipterygia]
MSSRRTDSHKFDGMIGSDSCFVPSPSLCAATMILRKFLTVFLLAVVASAGNLVLHETRSTAPNGFISHGPAPPGDLLTLRVALTSNNLAGLEEKVTLLATPGSSEFRQWLSMAEVKAFVESSPETVSAFDAFTSANNLTSTIISPNGDWVSISLPVSQANELFELVGHVDVIHPTTAFIHPKTRMFLPVKSGARIERAAPANDYSARL